MEISRVIMNIDSKDFLLDKLSAILHDNRCQEYTDEICKAFEKYIVSEPPFKLKPFNLEAAKSGKAVYTRDGRKVRIICFDSKSDSKKPIVALVENNNNELLYEYTIEGKDTFSHISTTGTNDLMIISEKKDGWINVYNSLGIITLSYNPYNTKEEALKELESTFNKKHYIDTIKISWEE